jgi:hypothetical protein
MGISADEKAKRREQWAYVQHSLWLEGFTFTDEDKALFERYVRGEITQEELHAAVAALIETSPDASS